MQKLVERLFRIWPIRRARWAIGMALAGAMLAAASRAAAAGSADLAAFLAAYRCDVVERLQMIHADRTPKVTLSALYEAYGARTGSRLQWQAPLAPGKGIFLVCAPVS